MNQSSTVTNSQLTEGYKQTEIGVIPEDWKLSKLGNHASFKTGPFGSLLHKHDYVDGGIPVINPMQINDGKLEPTHSMSITEDASKKLSNFRLCSGNIVIGRRGEMGRCAYVNPEQEGWLCGSGSMIIRVDTEIDARFIQRVLSSPASVNAIVNASVGSTMINLNQSALSNLALALPPTKAEQEAIACTLSDIDALIESLDRVLTKKCQIKQGAMQELLRSKEGWISAKLKDIAPLQRGFDLPSSQLAQGVYPVVYSNGIQNYHNRYMVREPGITTGRSGTLGVVNFITEKFWPHNTTLWVTDFKGNDPNFIYYLYIHIGFERFGSGSGVPTLNRNDAHDYLCSIPIQLSEQIEIANILSDMDAEIDAIESKLAKTRQLKQGMMHELLTGRIRLVDRTSIS